MDLILCHAFGGEKHSRTKRFSIYLCDSKNITTISQLCPLRSISFESIWRKKKKRLKDIAVAIHVHFTCDDNGHSFDGWTVLRIGKHAFSAC